MQRYTRQYHNVLETRVHKTGDNLMPLLDILGQCLRVDRLLFVACCRGCLNRSYGSLWNALWVKPPSRVFVRGCLVVFASLQVFVREPGGIGGQQFIVEECAECEVFLLDHTAALTIDACTDCRIFTGPCESR